MSIYSYHCLFNLIWFWIDFYFCSIESVSFRMYILLPTFCFYFNIYFAFTTYLHKYKSILTFNSSITFQMHIDEKTNQNDEESRRIRWEYKEEEVEVVEELNQINTNQYENPTKQISFWELNLIFFIFFWGFWFKNANLKNTTLYKLDRHANAFYSEYVYVYK